MKPQPTMIRTRIVEQPQANKTVRVIVTDTKTRTKPLKVETPPPAPPHPVDAPVEPPKNFDYSQKPHVTVTPIKYTLKYTATGPTAREGGRALRDWLRKYGAIPELEPATQLVAKALKLRRRTK